jgi:hypothetical protein
MKILILLISVLFAAGCGSSGSDAPSPPAERKFLFGIRSYGKGEQDFIAVSSRPEVISIVIEELKKPVSDRKQMINGAIARGNDGNIDWSWHFKPDDWDLAEISMELCDGLPSDVEKDIDYWIDTVGRFCPWASYVKKEITPD